eukprot:gene5491-11584_t
MLRTLRIPRRPAAATSRGVPRGRREPGLTAKAFALSLLVSLSDSDVNVSEAWVSPPTLALAGWLAAFVLPPLGRKHWDKIEPHAGRVSSMLRAKGRRPKLE